MAGFGDGVGDELERVAALLAARFQDGLHRLDEPAAAGTLSSLGQLSQLSFRRITSGRIARSAALLVGSTPSVDAKTHSASGRVRMLRQRPAMKECAYRDPGRLPCALASRRLTLATPPE